MNNVQRRMSAAKCDLNKTWTILPEDESDPGGGSGDGDEEMSVDSPPTNKILSTTNVIECCDDKSTSSASPMSIESSSDVYCHMRRRVRTVLEIFNINDDNFESLFDETYCGIEFEYVNDFLLLLLAFFDLELYFFHGSIFLFYFFFFTID